MQRTLSTAMKGPTRPLRDPTVQPDGTLVARTVATPRSFKVRGRVYVDSTKVIPVVFVPGTMGSNLKVRRDVPLPRHSPLKAGDPAWRPPNSAPSGLWEARDWRNRSPAERQMILNPALLEVDGDGPLDPDQTSLELSVMRERGWGEVFASSYGTLLATLQRDLNETFAADLDGGRYVRQAWEQVVQAMQGDTLQRWGVRNLAPVTEAELEKYAAFQYPLYAVGYNWLQSCAVSSQRLEKRVLDIIAWWQARKHQCHQVILLTHSMGGLVARACAKRIPDKIAGVVHGVMPALGAPLAYRRIACGTESTNPANGWADDIAAEKFAEIAGKTTEHTTPVMAASPGALELLPNQFYPRPWLHVRVLCPSGPTGARETAYDFLHLPNESKPNPYDLYRNTRDWWRLINPALADPAHLYANQQDGVHGVIGDAIDAAERFHRGLDNYYHPRTYAYFGSDTAHLSYGQIRWLARGTGASAGALLTPANIRAARFIGHAPGGERTVEVGGHHRFTFSPEPQDAPGDDTVPRQSGVGPLGKVRQVFSTRGYRHQESFKDNDMVLLTRYCIVKIVQELKQ
jgi:pimeloyl-ACP methyl ester carboxylesterase